MKTSTVIRGLLFATACLLAAQEAMAGASCVTRANCTALAKRYVTKTHMLCGIVPLCLEKGSGCGSAASSCDWRSCTIGGGMAYAQNGPGGCQIYTNRSGMGIAGQAIDPTFGLDADDASGTEVASSVVFDAVSGQVKIRLSKGSLTATVGGLAQRLRVTLFQEDPAALEEDQDPAPTADNTLWTGTLVVSGGALSITGFDASDFTTTTSDEGETVVTFSDAEVAVPLDLSAGDFANLALETLTDEFVPVG